MDRFQALAAFAKVVEQGSFARAAERLGRSTSVVSRQVSELEAHLGARLLNRTTRRLSLTETGEAYFERALQLIADLEEAEAAVTANALAPRGTLKLTAPITFGERHVAPAIAEFGAKFPELRFDIELSDRVVDLVEEGIDLAIRIGATGGQALIARRIGTTEAISCASPAYLQKHGSPAAPADLAGHLCLSYTYLASRDSWRFLDAAGVEHAVRITGPVRANNGRFLVGLALAGAGIVFEPDFIVGDDIRAGRLVRLLPAFAPPAAPIHAVYPSRRHLSAKVRAFVDFLAARFAAEAPWRLPPASGPTPASRPARKR